MADEHGALVMWRHNRSMFRWELAADDRVHAWIGDELLADVPPAARARFAADVRERYGLALPMRAFGDLGTPVATYTCVSCLAIAGEQHRPDCRAVARDRGMRLPMR